MKIITGGAGFIGSAICWRLNTLGIEDIIIVDSDMDGTKKKNLENLKYSEFMDKVTFLQKITNGTFRGKPDTLYHMGACTSTTEEDMEYLKKNNFEYSVHLAEWTLKNDIRYIYASSAATYGDGSMGFDDSLSLIPKLKPMNKYGLSKQMFDLWILENKYENRVAGLKYFNVFGPNENHKGDMRSMVNKAYSEIMKSGKLKLFKSYKTEFKDGEQKRDFIYIKDAVEMTIFFDLINPVGKSKNGIYNIGTGTVCTWNRLARAIFSSLDMTPDIVYVDMPGNIKNQYQYYTEANLDRLRNAGYNNKIMSIEDSVRDYVVNYLSMDKYLSVS